MKKTFKIPVSWEMYGYVNVEAESLDEAIKIVENDSNLPDGEYIGGSFEVDEYALEFEE